HLNGIAAQLKSQNPFITEHHCISHRLALACEDAAESIPYMHTYNKIVGNLYTYFSRSYECMETLKMVEKLLDDPDLHLLRIVKTRWLSLSNVVSNLHRILDSVVNALFLDSKTEKVAQSLLDSIDQTFYITTNFLADILGNLKRLTLSFQSEHISLTEIKLQIATVIQTINESFIGTENFSPTWGYHLRTYLQTNDLASEDIPDFIQQFAIATIENLNRQFPDRKILNAFSIFDPQNLLEKESLSDYGNDEIYILANYYGKEKTSKDLIQEWNFVRILLKNFASLKLLDAWKALYQKIPNFSVLYPNSYKIVELFLILPLSNAVVER
ncbi:11599_t:CDS:2, partial [Cetraspora pellucida]